MIEKLKSDHQAMVITQNSEAAMVTRSVTDYVQTQENLALLKMLAQSQQALADEKTVSRAEAFNRLRERRGLA